MAEVKTFNEFMWHLLKENDQTRVYTIRVYTIATKSIFSKRKNKRVMEKKKRKQEDRIKIFLSWD